MAEYASTTTARVQQKKEVWNSTITYVVSSIHISYELDILYPRRAERNSSASCVGGKAHTDRAVPSIQQIPLPLPLGSACTVCSRRGDPPEGGRPPWSSATREDVRAERIIRVLVARRSRRTQAGIAPHHTPLLPVYTYRSPSISFSIVIVRRVLLYYSSQIVSSSLFLRAIKVIDASVAVLSHRILS